MRVVIVLSLLASLAVSGPVPTRKLQARDPQASDGVSVLDTINKYRAAYGLNNLSWDDGV